MVAAAGAGAAPRSLRWRRRLTTDPNGILLLVVPSPTRPRERHCRPGAWQAQIGRNAAGGRALSTSRKGRRRRRMTRDVAKSGHLRRGWARNSARYLFSRPGAGGGRRRNTRAFFLCGSVRRKKKGKRGKIQTSGVSTLVPVLLVAQVKSRGYTFVFVLLWPLGDPARWTERVRAFSSMKKKNHCAWILKYLCIFRKKKWRCHLVALRHLSMWEMKTSFSCFSFISVLSRPTI